MQLSYPNACYLFANVYFDNKFQDQKIYSSHHHGLSIMFWLSLSPKIILKFQLVINRTTKDLHLLGKKKGKMILLHPTIQDA